MVTTAQSWMERIFGSPFDRSWLFRESNSLENLRSGSSWKWDRPVGGSYEYSFDDLPFFPRMIPRFPGEHEFRNIDSLDFNRKYAYLCYVALALYLIAVFWGQRIMLNRKAFRVKKFLAAWNLLLGVFSAIGFSHLFSHLVYLFARGGFEYLSCRGAEQQVGVDASSCLWLFLFIYSKYVELFDTAFLVLRKRPVVLLHWYHHATVLVYCVEAYAAENPIGLVFASMNYGVHAVMYFYYFLTSIGYRPKWDFFVTTIQLSQMVVGITMNLIHIYYRMKYADLVSENGDKYYCDGSWHSVIAAGIMYLSYFLLFLQLFVKRYVTWASEKDRENHIEKVEGKKEK